MTRVLREFVDLVCDRLALDVSGVFLGVRVPAMREAVHEYIARGDWVPNNMLCEENVR